MTRIFRLASASVAALLLLTAPADAQRGGRGGGRVGGGRAGGVNRPSLPGGVNRPSLPGGVSRPSLPSGVNRPSLPSGGVNRPSLPGGGVNRPSLPSGGTRPSLPNIGNRPSYPGGGARPPVHPSPRPPIAGGGRPPAAPGWGWGAQPGWGRPPAWGGRPGWNNHNAWVNGYWHGRNNSWWSNSGAFFTGMAIGGVGAWGLNSAFWGWGYRPFMNPYIAVQQPVVVQQPVPVAATAFDYSQPLQTAEPPAPETTDPAMRTFDEARAAFQGGEYDAALRQTDEALKTLSNDAAIHEFRALCLFALKRYDEAAGVLYAVLSAGPGWDWTTLIGLYPSVDAYTAQLRWLEEYRRANPTSAPARFVLGYHYLTQNHAKAALAEFQEVVKLQPADKLSAQLVALLSGDQEKSSAETAAAPPPPADEPKGSPVGAWKASPEAGVSIDLTLGDDGGFRWNVVQGGQSQPIEGKYTLDNGVLSLVRSDDDAMVGRVTWKTDSEFVFQAMGGGPNDPGLTFKK